MACVSARPDFFNLDEQKALDPEALNSLSIWYTGSEHQDIFALEGACLIVQKMRESTAHRFFLANHGQDGQWVYSAHKL